MSVRGLSVGLLGACGLLAVGFLVGPVASASAVPSSVGASWVGAQSQALTFVTTGLNQNGSLGRLVPGSPALGSSWLRAGPSIWSAAGSLRPVSGSVLASACDPASWQEPSFSPSSPALPYSGCDPALYQVEVVQAVMDLRDVLVYGLGLLLLTSSASMVLLMVRRGE